MTAQGRVDAAPLPLVLDLGGTLLKTDLLLESLIVAIKGQPMVLLLCLWWMVKGGRAEVKRRLAQRVRLRFDLLPLNQPMVDYAAQRHAGGHAIYIVTAADESLARGVADRLPFACEVIASTTVRSLKGDARAAVLKQRFPGGFTYAGDSAADIPVWRAASEGVFAGTSRGVRTAAAQAGDLVADLHQQGPTLTTWLSALRIHQWAKNALVIIPLLLSGQGGNLAAWGHVLTALLGMGMVSSSTYLMNDGLDLADDRAHWSKKDRALASGAVPLIQASIATPVGLVIGLGLGFAAGGLPGLACLTAYLVVTLLYSLRFKRFAMVDVLIIGGLFTLRLLLGAEAAQAPLRPWLFVFSMFLFTALALAKRQAEIQRMGPGGGRVGGRGYHVVDGPIVTAFGVSSSVAAILVLVLYILDEAFLESFYGAPQCLWAAPIVLSLWLGRIWLKCGRGELDDDPVAFAVHDRVSLGMAAVVGVAAILSVVL
jgi:4-hydroxybenzoate polyprenyltransferase